MNVRREDVEKLFRIATNGAEYRVEKLVTSGSLWWKRSTWKTCSLSDDYIGAAMHREVEIKRAFQEKNKDGEWKVLPNSSEAALSVAWEALYFDDSSDYRSALVEIVRTLGGNEAIDMLELDARQGFEKYIKVKRTI